MVDALDCIFGEDFKSLWTCNRQLFNGQASGKRVYRWKEQRAEEGTKGGLIWAKSRDD